MRPRLKDNAVFIWEGADGSRVRALSLPSEYTTWTYDALKEELGKALAAAEDCGLQEMVCCFGVGNHGGGPTIENIEAVYRLQKENPDLKLLFSDYDRFFASLDEERLPLRKDFFNRVSVGAYSMDAKLKQANRRAEEALLRCEFMLLLKEFFLSQSGFSNADALKAEQEQKELSTLWKKLLFNHFHDTICGTIIPEARDEAIAELAGISYRCGTMINDASQAMVNACDTVGEGMPLFIFNPNGQKYEHFYTFEIPWHCREQITILDENGEEVPYQRTYTQAKARNYHIGGRRRLIIPLSLDALSFKEYRIIVKEPDRACDVRIEPEFPLQKNEGLIPDDDPFILENNQLSAKFSEAGFLYSLYDKKNNYEALGKEITFPIILDERDAWGGRQFRAWQDSGKRLSFDRLDLIESGPLRKVVRARYHLDGRSLEQRFILYHDNPYLEIENKLLLNTIWESIHMALPRQGRDQLTAEKAYGEYRHKAAETMDYCMHRYVDLTDQDDRGLLLVNDSKYAYSVRPDSLNIILSRNAIMAQGYGKNWYRDTEDYYYADLGMQRFSFLLYPHGIKADASVKKDLAFYLARPLHHLMDSQHPAYGEKRIMHKGFASYFAIDKDNVILNSLKKAEDGRGLILRLVETAGKGVTYKLNLNGQEYLSAIGPWEIQTLRFCKGYFEHCNLLEEREEHPTE